MAAFDVIEAGGKGYSFAWAERRYLLRLALVPLLIKLVCHTVVLTFEWQTDFMRQALVMLPSYFADGWLMAHLVRLVFLEQRWPFRPTGNKEQDLTVLEDRARGVLSGVLVFALIKFLLAGVVEGAADPERGCQVCRTGVLCLLARLWPELLFCWPRFGRFVC